MRARCLRVVAFLFLVASLAFGQGATASITGTVTDPSGLVVAGVAIEARNAETGAIYEAASTSAGDYTVPGLPVGTYVLTARSAGFKTYAHSNLALTAAQALREDIPLEVGAAAETITVSAEASLLKTESAELSHNVTLEQLDDLPLIVIGTANGLRNFLSSMITLPGTYGGNGSTVINGLGQGFVTSEIVKVEGQDASNRLFNNYEYTTMNEPNVDAIQEIAFQVSNYAPEFGQAGSAVINTTMKSGTNRYHGTGFEYFVNEDLNAGYPFSSNGSGGKFRPRNRKNDFGGTLGGPVSIPKLYNGKNKTFFFWAYEEYKLTQLFSFNDTVPTTAFLNGDFSGVSPNGNCSLCAQYGIPTTSLGTDALGRSMYANEIYDPTTRAVNPANGLGYANPFPNNVIPPSRFSQTALAFQKLFPAPGNSNLTSNYSASVPGGQYSVIPSLKIDQIISQKDKVSFYWSRTNAESAVNTGPQAADGLPFSIGAYRGAFIPTNTVRLNYDRTLTPTILFHFGAGYLGTSFSDKAPFLNFNPSQFDLTGFLQNRQTPTISGMCTLGVAAVLGGVAPCASGGMQNIGTSGQLQSQIYEQRPTFNANVTWVKGSHTFKFGSELEIESVIGGNADFSGVTLNAGNTTVGSMGIGATAQPFTPTGSFNGFTQGYGYANFLLGDFSSTTQTPSYLYSREGYQLWGFFAQDSWKITRKLTVDYGVRYDYATPEKEQYGRLGQFDPTVANPNAGGSLGGYRYASTCNCNFYKSAYPYGIGPRIGAAYQIAPKTVLRAGWGLNYQFIANPAGALVASGGVYPLSGINPFVNIATPGAIVQPIWPATNATIYPIAGTAGVAGQTPTVPDQNENRPPRINQFSVSIQREITRDFVVEASYVANRAVWLAGSLGELSQISAQTYAKYGLYPYPGTGPAGYNYTLPGDTQLANGSWTLCVPGNDCDRALLSQSVSSPAVQQKMAAAGHPNFTPYSGFPTGNTLLSALYPYPQYGNLAITGSPTGNTKYDSLQIKVTKRLSHGLQAGGNYTWGQGFQRPTRQDFFNPQSNPWQLQNIPLQVLNFNATYTVPKASFLPRYANVVTSDWQVGWYASYQSGMYLTPPTSPTANFLTSQDIRVSGQPLYTAGVNINDHSTFNPYSTQVLNPLAWQACPTNSVCPAASTLYKDFKGPRVPSENANLGRHFRVGKEGKYDFYIRAEFVNVFNRTYFGNPITTNPQNKLTYGAGNGTILTGGFGVINAYVQPNTAYGFAGRTGTLIARFQF
jgi:hypothetical protein